MYEEEIINGQLS